MAGFGGYYKGEKKKQKKDKQAKNVFKDAPSFSMPEIISKNKQA